MASSRIFKAYHVLKVQLSNRNFLNIWIFEKFESTKICAVCHCYWRKGSISPVLGTTFNMQAHTACTHLLGQKSSFAARRWEKVSSLKNIESLNMIVFVVPCCSSYFHVRFCPGLVLLGNLFSMADPPLVVPLLLFGMQSFPEMSSLDL
jgi:hypothetical protein